MMTRAVILTGGNKGDVKSRLQQAQQLINERVGPVLRCSHRYESEAWGFEASEPFSNQVLEVSTDLEPDDLLDVLQAIEQELGRDRTAEASERERTGQCYASRMIDVDLLFYGSQVICTPRLKVPHPRIAERAFVLRPLCEILPQMCHPVSGRTMTELFEELKLNDEK